MRKLNILFPTDFGNSSIDLLNQILALLKDGGNRLTLIHAASHQRKTEAADRVIIEEKFEEFIAACPGLAEIVYEKKWRFGLIKDLILSTSDLPEIDLIIMGTGGAQGFDKLWSSKTESIIRDALVPVLVMPKKAELKALNHLVLASDFDGGFDAENLNLISDWLSESKNSTISVVTVNESESSLSREAKRNRKTLKFLLRDQNCQFVLAKGKSVSEGLFDYAHHHQADILALRPRNYTNLERLFGGSLAKEMVLSSKLPLLILN